jgi:peptide/nickel transport system substrate-binding protein
MRHRRTLGRLLGILLTFGLIAAACGDDDDGGAEEETTETTAAPEEEGEGEETEATTTTAAEEEAAATCDATVPGSVLNFGVYTATASLDPLTSSGALTGGTDLAAIYDVLFRWNPETNEWDPHVAESIESNADFTEWTLTLKEGITYGNGETLTAQDVLDNINRMLGPGRNASRGFLSRIDLANTVVQDEQTIVFTLLKPWSAFPYALADAPGMIVNPRVAANVDSAGASIVGTDPTGAGVGPYEVERWAPGESPYLVLKARPDYWGGPVCIETINMINIPVDATKADALENGELDIAFVRTADVIKELRETGEYEEMFALQSAGAMVLINNNAGTHNPITSDARFRQAVQLAIDPEQISQRAFGGELLGSSSLIHPDSNWYSDGLPELSVDPDAASALVEELKAEGWDGNVRLVCPDTNPDVPVALEASLEAVGMNVDSQVADTNTHIAAVAVNKDFDMACWGMNISDSAIWRQIGFNFESTSPSNRIGYANPAMDAAIDELFAAPDDDARREAVVKITEIFVEDVPSAPYAAVEEGIFISPRVQGILETQQTVFLLHDAVLVEE